MKINNLWIDFKLFLPPIDEWIEIKRHEKYEMGACRALEWSRVKFKGKSVWWSHNHYYNFQNENGEIATVYFSNLRWRAL